mmetsp:Transcript_67472/g.175174  ORF Transcript_67472/g.175174 Transcript_67472/m.175174 type:complete len:217 (+) Transcript_67472:21-671(+)
MCARCTQLAPMGPRAHALSRLHGDPAPYAAFFPTTSAERHMHSNWPRIHWPTGGSTHRHCCCLLAESSPGQQPPLNATCTQLVTPRLAHASVQLACPAGDPSSSASAAAPAWPRSPRAPRSRSEPPASPRRSKPRSFLSGGRGMGVGWPAFSWLRATNSSTSGAGKPRSQGCSREALAVTLSSGSRHNMGIRNDARFLASSVCMWYFCCNTSANPQ